MKPFNLEAAKKGAPVCIRDGNPVRLLCFDTKGRYPISGLIEYDNDESACSWANDGRRYIDGESEIDLMMVDLDTDDESCVSDDFVEKLAQRIIEKMDEQRKRNITEPFVPDTVPTMPVYPFGKIVMYGCQTTSYDATISTGTATSSMTNLNNDDNEEDNVQ